LLSDIPPAITIDAVPTDGSTNAVSSNGVFDALALKADKTSWIDYSATSTVIGWSSFTNKNIFYKIIDDCLFCYFLIEGTSNSTSTSFTLPFNSLQTNLFTSTLMYNNGNAVTTVSKTDTASGSNLIRLYPTVAGANWVASNTKIISGQFFIKI
jgi:hypothetical protein